jgi:hypothetical protein
MALGAGREAAHALVEGLRALPTPEADAVGAARVGVARSPEEGIHAAMIHVTHRRVSRLAIATGT